MKFIPIFLLVIPLALSAFTHLWNPVGFPNIQIDEGTYMRRAMHVLEGQGPQEPKSTIVRNYDHPYFGQLFLASILGIIGYPYSFVHLSAAANNTTTDDAIHSVEMLYMVPRVLMGLLAVVDTFLIYKIAEWRYNRKVAFIASILFAVMPITWLMRRIYLDNLLMPFLLSSILFAVYYAKKNSYSYSSSKLSSSSKRSSIPSSITTTFSSSSSSLTTYGKSNNNKKKKNILLILLSGIFLGLAIFTKIPAFTMIPLIGYLIISTNENSNKNNNDVVDNSTISRRITRRITNLRNLNLKALGLWFIPVIVIPAIWPAYAILIGEFDNWMDGIFYQTHRLPKPLWNTLNAFFQMDPFLFITGIVGLIFAASIKRDFILLTWIIPYLIFLYILGYVSHIALILLIPIFCISAAVLIEGLSDKISKIKKNSKKNIIIVSQKILPYAMISTIGIFGLVSISMLITTNVSSFQYKVTAFLVQHLLNNKVDGYTNNDITIFGTSSYFWIPKDIFQQQSINYKGLTSKKPIETEKTILIVDKDFRNLMSSSTDDGERLRTIYEGTNMIATTGRKSISYDIHTYPYTSMKFPVEDSKIELRTN